MSLDTALVIRNELHDLCETKSWPELLQMSHELSESEVKCALFLPFDYSGAMLINSALYNNCPPEVVQLFIDYDDVNGSMFAHKSNDGSTPLLFAAGFSSSLEVVKMVAQQQPPSLYAKNDYGDIPLHSAAACDNNVEIVAYLHRQYPQGIRMKNNDGSTPLAIAAYESTNLDVISYLIAKFPEALNEKDEDDDTPLKLAKKRNNEFNELAIIISLLENETENYNSPANQTIRYNENLRVNVKCSMTVKKEYGLVTPMNALSRSEFVFRILDEFQNCGWYGKVDELVAYVGLGVKKFMDSKAIIVRRRRFTQERKLISARRGRSWSR